MKQNALLEYTVGRWAAEAHGGSPLHHFGGENQAGSLYRAQDGQTAVHEFPAGFTPHAAWGSCGRRMWCPPWCCPWNPCDSTALSSSRRMRNYSGTTAIGEGGGGTYLLAVVVCQCSVRLGLTWHRPRQSAASSSRHHAEASVWRYSWEGPATKRTAVSKVCLFSLSTVSSRSRCRSPPESCGLENCTATCFGHRHEGHATRLQYRADEAWPVTCDEMRVPEVDDTGQVEAHPSHAVYSAAGVVLHHDRPLCGGFR